MIKKFIRLHVKYPLFFSGFNETLTFLADFRKILNIRFHANPPSAVGTDLFYEEGWTDRQSGRQI
jgi:hypothetical protein